MKTVLLIDGANIFATAKNLNFSIDYKRLKEFFKTSYDIRRMYYFTALREITDEESGQSGKVPLRPLVDWLSYHGFCPITKPAKVSVNREGVEKIKGNMDVEIAVTAMRAADYAECIVLCTGDGDFRCLVENLQYKGVYVVAVSSIQTTTPMIADELRRQVDEFIDLADIQHLIEQENRNND